MLKPTEDVASLNFSCHMNNSALLEGIQPVAFTTSRVRVHSKTGHVLNEEYNGSSTVCPSQPTSKKLVYSCRVSVTKEEISSKHWVFVKILRRNR